jgi:hypothetical protein
MSQTNPDIRTMQDLVRNALQVQDACNMSGIARSFALDVARLRILIEGMPGFNSDMLSRHPVCVMWSSKIASLTGSEIGMRFSRAYDWCQQVGADSLPPLPVDAN